MMDTEELMTLAADKASKEMGWESIEYLLKPLNMGELLLRLDFEGTSEKVIDALLREEPNILVIQESQIYKDWSYAISKERFYLKCKEARHIAVHHLPYCRGLDGAMG